MRIGFFGTPELSAHVLDDLIQAHDMNVVFVVTNPDKPSGRDGIPKPSPVKRLAEAHAIPVLQPEKIRGNQHFLEALHAYQCDYFVVVAYGKILPEALLDIPKFLSLNVHGSLLPQYRGASPIQSALLQGEKYTGVTIMQMSAGMDEWDIITTAKIDIDPQETSGSLFHKFSRISGNTLIDAIRGLSSGKYTPTPQRHDEATYCSKITKEDGKIRWNEDAQTIYRRWQAYTPWPGIFTTYQGKRLLIEIPSLPDAHEYDKMWRTYGEGGEHMANIGRVIRFWSEKVGVICGTWILLLERLKLEGKKSQSIWEFLHWHQTFISSTLW